MRSLGQNETGMPQVCRILRDQGLVHRVGVVLLALLLFLGADASRVDHLGHQVICMCGCNQILLECNHLGCPYLSRMKQELTAAVDRGDSDKAIIQSFVQTYGTLVLAAPTNRGFDRIAWIMPYLVLLVGIVVVVLVVRAWRKRPAPIHASVPAPVRGEELDRFREQARREAGL